MDGVPFCYSGSYFTRRFPPIRLFFEAERKLLDALHYGLQEQQLLAAPMVIRSPTQSKVADAEFTVMLSDFSFTSPQDILKDLMGGTQAMKGKAQKKSMSDGKAMRNVGAEAISHRPAMG